MTALNGLLGIDSSLVCTVASISLSPLRAVLIPQFDDRHGVVHAASQRSSPPHFGRQDGYNAAEPEPTFVS